MRFAGYVTVSGRDETSSLRACDEVEQAARQALARAHPCWGEQDVAFVSSGAADRPRTAQAASARWHMMWSRVRLAERDAHRATTANAQAIYPFVAESGLGGRGALIGVDLHGAAFTYDPFVLYEQRVISNPNLFIAGEVGSGKSSLVKTYLFRQAVFGRIPWVADPKGEYAPLARALGEEPIRLSPGGDVRLNPITRDAGWDGQLELLRALAAGALERRLAPEEEAAVREALRALNAELPEPVLPRTRRAAVPANAKRWPTSS